MPIITKSPNGIIRKDETERLQIMNFFAAKEDVSKMNIEVYFNVSKFVGEERISLAWDEKPLVFDCKDDLELKAAMEVIQSRIGQKRYLQITAPPEIPESVENPGLMQSEET